MHTYDYEIICSPASVAEMRSLLGALEGVSIVDITEVQEAQVTYASMKITLTDSGKSAIAGAQAVQLTTALD